MLRTAECVSPMHPDKICDRISDAVLDACLKEDPNSRVAIETMGGHGIITITGELTTKANIDIREIARKVSGYNYGVQVNVVKQSPEIAQGVDTGGAGDQGIMVGYATSETPEMMPMEVMMARRLCQFIYSSNPYDGKTQVTYDDEKERIVSIVASFQKVPTKTLEHLVRDWADCEGIDYGYSVYANPAGDWSQGGFEADTGLTGRKLAVDNYGPTIPVGGGAFSGKDGTKVDRSGAYMARRLAVQMCDTAMKANEGAKVEVYVRLAYAIGKAEPVEATAIQYVNGKEQVIDILADKGVYNEYLTPKGMIEALKLREPVFARTAEWGHFGNGFEWDK